MPLKALVVDDEPVICRVCRKILAEQGYVVDTALSGQSALELARAQRYDFYVSDLRMPEMTGMQLWEQFQKEQPALAQHSIFITGDILSPDVHAFLEKVRNPRVTKPFTPSDLAGAVNKATAEWGLLPASKG
jgi:two-component system NtrC family sensor kinase